jgi:hypothetical protein
MGAPRILLAMLLAGSGVLLMGCEPNKSLGQSLGDYRDRLQAEAGREQAARDLDASFPKPSETDETPQGPPASSEESKPASSDQEAGGEASDSQASGSTDSGSGQDQQSQQQ